MKSQKKSSFEVMISKAARLEQIHKQISQLSNEEKELKDFFKNEMESQTEKFGDVTISLVDKTRAVFDRNLFIKLNGKEAAAEYTKYTDYVSVIVQRA